MCHADTTTEVPDRARPTPTRSTEPGQPDEDAESTVFVLGAGPIGEAVAERLGAEGVTVTLIDESLDAADPSGQRGDPADMRILEEAGMSEDSMVLVATPHDRRNLLIAQLVRARFGVSRVLVLANGPDRYELLADAGLEPICVTTVLSDALAGEL